MSKTHSNLQVSFSGKEHPTLKEYRERLRYIGLKSKALDEQKLTLSLLINENLKMLDNLTNQVDGIKKEQVEVYDMYFEVYDKFKEFQSYVIK